MKKNILLIGSSLLAAQLSGCATHTIQPLSAFQAENLNSAIQSGQFVQKTQSFLILHDASSSMSDAYPSANATNTKLDVERNLLNAFNLTIPKLDLQGGLRSFGFGPCTDWSQSLLKQALGPYQAADLQRTVQTLDCASGGTPLADALASSNQDLQTAPGNLALIVFSDGEDEMSPVPATQALRQRYGDRLCIYTVWIGTQHDLRGKANLEQIATTGGCGFATSADAIQSPAGMRDFVERVFLKPVPKPQDDDQDGVENARDKCPDTPKGALVDKDGCWAIHGVLFDFDSSRIKTSYAGLLDNAVHVMRINPGLKIIIEGHTDSMGSDAYNQKLSEQRASAVKHALVQKGIDAKRMRSVGFGESKPIDSNASAEGRANNRRVVYQRDK